MASLLEQRLASLPWRKQKPCPDYAIPDAVRSRERPVVLYPAAGTDFSLVEKLAGSGARLFYQDIAYGPDIMMLAPEHRPDETGQAELARFTGRLASSGVTVLTGALGEDTLDEKADMALIRGTFGFLFQNSFAEMVLANCREGCLICGDRFDLDALSLMVDGLERPSRDLMVVRPYTASGLHRWLTRFPEMSFWALNGAIRTFSTTAEAKRKFGRSGHLLVEREISAAPPDELSEYFTIMPPRLYPAYVREHLVRRGFMRR